MILAPRFHIQARLIPAAMTGKVPFLEPPTFTAPERGRPPPC